MLMFYVDNYDQYISTISWPPPIDSMEVIVHHVCSEANQYLHGCFKLVHHITLKKRQYYSQDKQKQITSYGCFLCAE